MTPEQQIDWLDDELASVRQQLEAIQVKLAERDAEVERLKVVARYAQATTQQSLGGIEELERRDEAKEFSKGDKQFLQQRKETLRSLIATIEAALEGR